MKAREIPAFAPPPDWHRASTGWPQVDVERSQEFRKCIECFLCQNTCHVVRDHEDNKKAFAGPRFLMRIAELDMHPLDAADRQTQAQDEFGLGYCNITKCCTEVCPEHIKITDNALIPMKERVVDRKVRSAGHAARQDRRAALALKSRLSASHVRLPVVHAQLPGRVRSRLRHRVIPITVSERAMSSAYRLVGSHVPAPCIEVSRWSHGNDHLDSINSMHIA